MVLYEIFSVKVCEICRPSDHIIADLFIIPEKRGCVKAK